MTQVDVVVETPVETVENSLSVKDSTLVQSQLNDSSNDLVTNTKNNKQNKKSKKKNERQKKIDISPEHIAQVRAKREAARKAKRDALLAQGIDPDCPKELQFIKRPILQMHENEPVKGFKFSLMTYNCLAQALIRRKLFPEGGDALKWHRRSKVLLNEFKHYNPDIICLQEIDHVQYQSFWKEEFSKLGYECQFYKKPSKNHGVSVVWKKELFEMTDRMLVDYDKELSGDIEPRTTTNNIALLLSLKFSKKVTERFPKNINKTGILIGTTHLFWHPFGTYERTRQCYIILNKMKEFIDRVNILQNNGDKDFSHWYPFFCGDFNSQPFDSPYLSMTSKPIKYSGRSKTVIECSTSFKFSKKRDGEEGDDEEGGNIEKFGKDQPQHPVPDDYQANDEQKLLVTKMQELHNSLDMRAISLYSAGYSKVHPENSGIDNERNEPEISNWAHIWRGLLDYLFYIKSWDFTPNKEIDSLEDFERENDIKIRGYLRMPPAKELPSHGQPFEGEYPSDHLCMLCEVELCL
ncbi:hypothetical protein TBLA_0B02900 [Henningerozyma blattae CBS 6284]|uniref:Endonuclease/exonuclease/phosphatase domain-containing protein n=1 Tax=Henningerozyma blattae (strain ATCC 34711 / CBS 6284 / DSM 70876 / NBRC 10599 / NRRL Y-10934 / UCD 77-7) TaxID=1071380 RepID=I2GYD0_HENB6|nr:hypothetical protein TBLA_0B02900 [Tetrapisispora blattae CBS 6284]CCH59132.1 hypothetical protein TBLA_0B02900 [Tetrapisispora blattae CBS 6284]